MGFLLYFGRIVGFQRVVKLLDVALIQLDKIDKMATVHDSVLPQGSWNIEKPWEAIHQNVCDSIKTMVPPVITTQNDVLAWRHTNDAIFTMRVAYKPITVQQDENDPLFRAIWKWRGSKRMRIQAWKVARQALLTNESRHNLGLARVEFVSSLSGGKCVYYSYSPWLYLCATSLE